MTREEFENFERAVEVLESNFEDMYDTMNDDALERLGIVTERLGSSKFIEALKELNSICL